jgi:hypothetical protein
VSSELPADALPQRTSKDYPTSCSSDIHARTTLLLTDPTYIVENTYSSLTGWGKPMVGGSGQYDSDQYDKVDPAALLLAVLAVSVPPLIAPGAWDPVSTVTALVIGAIVFCFTWPHPPQRYRSADRWMITAQSLVFGLLASVALAWPVQSIFALMHSYKFSDCVVTVTETCGDQITKNHYDALGTWIGFLLGGVVAWVFWVQLRSATMRQVWRPPASPPA